MDTAAWAQAGIKAADALKIVNDQLLRLHLHDASAAGTEQLLLELARLNPPPPPLPPTCGDCAGPRVPVRPLFLTIGASAGDAAAFEKAVRPAIGWQVVQISKKTPITPAAGIPPVDRLMIQAAVPRQALVKPKSARKLLIIDLCPPGGFYHHTIFACQFCAGVDGQEPVFNNDLDNLKYPKIKEYDAVFLNSVVGLVFSDPDVISGLIRYVREGGGLAAIHGSTFASTDVPEYGELLGATTAPHIAFDVAMLKIDDPNSPITKHTLKATTYYPTLTSYHFPPNGPYSRDELHVLMSINIAKSPPRRPVVAVRPDNDYGLVWIKAMAMGGSSIALWVTRRCSLPRRKWLRWFLPESSLHSATSKPTQLPAPNDRANRKLRQREKG